MNTPVSIEDKIAELQDQGFCILKDHFSKSLVGHCREGLRAMVSDYTAKHRDKPNRGPHRHFFPMPFEPPCFACEFFFDAEVLRIVRGVMDERIVADQWGCDVPLRGSEYQKAHADFQRPLFAEAPDLLLPFYMLVVSFGLIDITLDHGPLEVGPRTHRMGRQDALCAVESGEIAMQPLPLGLGDVLIRHPWVLHRGTPNITDTPRPLVSIRYVRRWYADDSREVNAIPRVLWEALTSAQQSVVRFPIAD